MAWQYRGDLLRGASTTVAVGAAALAAALPPALLVALGRRFGPWPLAGLLGAFVTLVRAVPAIFSLVVVFYSLPFAGITLSPFPSLVLTLACVHVAYYSEVFHGALRSVGHGQVEGARALGMTMPDMLRHVVGPQSLRVATPAFVSASIQLAHNTTIASVVTLRDLLGAALDVQTLTGDPAPLLVAAGLYWAALLPLVWIARRAERRMRHRETWLGSPTTS